MAENEQEDDTIKMTQKQLTDFISALRAELVSAITENNQQAMMSLFEQVFPPFIERMEQIAIGQITLANALKTNRRDANANEFAKLLVARALATPEGIDRAAIYAIPAESYALADEMDLHGRVAEAQAQGKGELMDAAVAAAPRHVSPKDLVDNFFGRKPKAEAPSAPTKKAPDKKKH